MKKLTISLFLLLTAVLAACGGSQVEMPTAEPIVEPTSAALEPVNPTPIPPPPTQEPVEEAYPPPPAPPADSGAYPPPTSGLDAYPGAGNGAQLEGDARLFVIVPDESEAIYTVDEEFLSGAVQQLGQALGLTDTVGRSSDIEGELVLDLTAANPLVSGQFTVDLRTLTSDDSRRDNRIRNEWLESNRYPLAEFRATAVENFPANYIEGQTATFQLVGDMTIRQITQSVVFEVTAILNNGVITGEATADMRMTDFGFNPPNMANLFTVADEFSIEITFTARETN